MITRSPQANHVVDRTKFRDMRAHVAVVVGIALYVALSVIAEVCK